MGLEPSAYGTLSMRRTKVAQICKKTGNLRAVQLLLSYTKLEHTVRNHGVDIVDALTRSKGIDLQCTFPPIGAFLRRLARSGLEPNEDICKMWTSEPDSFILHLLQLMPGPNRCRNYKESLPWLPVPAEGLARGSRSLWRRKA